ncbi:MAG: hypothetical protein HY070_10895, partial [Chloroflexi bacterium]|nr:hypothetical protein [Chloroflexota bacterium]
AAITSPLTNNQRRDIFLAGLFLGVNAYIDFQIAAFLGLFSALYALYEFIALATRGRARANGRADYFALTRTFAAIALTALVIAAPMLGIIANDFAIEGGDYIRVFKMEYSAARSYDLAMFFIPSARSALYANVPLKIPGVNTGQTVDDVGPLSPDRQVFLGFTALALALIGYARGGRAARFWIFIAAAFALFSLGPALHLWGQDTRVPLPYLILHEIPILNHIRIPMRYGVMVMIAFAILVGLGIFWLMKKIASRQSLVARKIFHFAAFCVLPTLILVEAALIPYPIQSVAMPRVYADLARVPGDFSILEIPTFNWRAAAAMLLRSLRILEGAEKGFLTNAELAEDKRARDQVIAFFAWRYALVHRDWLTPDDTRALDAYLREVLDARVFSDDGTVIAYELPRARVASTTQIDLRENIGQLYAGRGWQFEYPQANWEGQFNFVWTRGARSEIYFRAADARDQTLTIRAYAAEPQRVQIALNGTRVAELTLTREWKDYRVTLPARSMIAMNRVDFIFDTDLQETVGVTTIEIK